MNRTRLDAQHYVVEALGDYADDFNIDAIIDEIHKITGTYNMEIDQEAFWEIVKRNHTDDSN